MEKGCIFNTYRYMTGYKELDSQWKPDTYTGIIIFIILGIIGKKEIQSYARRIIPSGILLWEQPNKINGKNGSVVMGIFPKVP